MKNTIRSILLKSAPGLFYAISSVRFFQRCKQRYEVFQNKFASNVYHGREIKILAGPFTGMPYYKKVIWGPITSKWIGSYEEELHPVVSEIISNNYTKIIDVGAAEGYYAVGFAYMCPNSQILSYDIDPIARFRQKQLAKMAGISNLEILKYCSHVELNRVASEGCLVMSDVEGFELELINPIKCEALKHCDILVEIHKADGLDVPQVEEAIAERFLRTHEITRFGVTPRDVGAYQKRLPALAECSLQEIEFALEEGRMPTQRWLWMKTK